VRGKVPRAKVVTHVCADSSSPRSTSLDRRVHPQAFLRKAQPQITEVLSTCQDLVGLDNRVTGFEETRAALLQLHGIQNELNDQRIAVLRHEWLGSIR